MSRFKLELSPYDGEWLLTIGRREYSYYSFYSSDGQVAYRAWVCSNRYDTEQYASRRHRAQSRLVLIEQHVRRSAPVQSSPGDGGWASLYSTRLEYKWKEVLPLSFLIVTGRDFYNTLPPQLRQMCEKEKYADAH